WIGLTVKSAARAGPGPRSAPHSNSKSAEASRPTGALRIVAARPRCTRALVRHVLEVDGRDHRVIIRGRGHILASRDTPEDREGAGRPAGGHRDGETGRRARAPHRGPAGV